MVLKGQVAVVTGAGKGVGKEAAKELLKNGVNVIAVTRNAADLEELEKETKESQAANEVKLIPISGDVSKEETIEKVVSVAKERFGKVHILINNAGIGRYGKLEELSIEDYDAMMDSNMRSTFLFTKGILPFMKEQKYGHIVNVASGKRDFQMKPFTAQRNLPKLALPKHWIMK